MIVFAGLSPYNLVKVLKIDEVAPEVSLQDLGEVKQMLSERVDVWINRGVQQGMQAGRHDVLNRQLCKKFGPLSDQQRATLESLDEEAVLEISEKIFDANSIEEVLKGH